MLTKETKKRIDDARDTLVGVLPLPTDQIELITIGLIYKFMDDQDEELRQSGFDEKFFKGTLKDYSWQQLMSNQISADQRVTKFINGIEQIQKATEIPLLFKEIFQNAFLKFRDGKVLQRFLDLINGFSYSHSEELGNAFEYLLKTMGSQGDNGQFRTPKNIIDFIVDVVNPLKTDTILDPACGTGGFLVSSFKHLLRTNTKGFEHTRFTINEIDEEKIYQNLGDKLTTDERKNIEKNIAGYDNTPLMVRLARVNLYLHHFNNPKIHEYNTLITDTRWKDRYDCILANPPFMTPKGGIDPHDKFRIPANRTEILFSSYILQHLNSEKGKAGFIIPEGIIFTTSGDYVALRKWLLYEAGLWAVVSLPANVFQPYSGVKTSILFIDKEVARNRTEVLMLKIENDGFSLNTNRNEIKANDLPEALQWLELSKTNKEEFVKQLEAKKEDAFAKKIQFLHRDEFAKLDAYKSSSLAFNFCTKLYDGIIKLKESIEVQINEVKAEISTTKDKKKTEQLKEKIEKANEKFDKKLKEFFKITSITLLPTNKEELKTWFDTNIKDNAIDFGINLTNEKLPTAIKEYIESQRDYNLSFDRFTNEKIFNDDIEYVRIEELCKVFADGDWIEKADQSEYGIRLIQTGNVGFGKFKNKDIEKARYVNEETFERLNCTEIFTDDILISRLPDPVGRACKIPILRERLITAVDCTILRFDEAQLLPDYFIYLTLSDEYYKRINENLTGASRQRISRTNLGNLLIPKPSIETQQKIVDEIDQYQKVIDGCNLLIENYKPFFEIQEDWEVVKLGDFCQTTSGGTPLRSNLQFYENGTIPWLKSGEVAQGEIFEAEEFITKDALENSSAKLIPKNSVLLAMYGATAGQVGILRIEASTNQAICSILPNKNILPEYLFLFLKSKKSYLISLSSGGAQPNISQSIIKDLLLPIPSLEIQNIIVEDYKKELLTINGVIELKSKMELKIKEVIDKVW